MQKTACQAPFYTASKSSHRRLKACQCLAKILEHSLGAMAAAPSRASLPSQKTLKQVGEGTSTLNA